jgi:hypothetical protein
MKRTTATLVTLSLLASSLQNVGASNVVQPHFEDWTVTRFNTREDRVLPEASLSATLMGDYQWTETANEFRVQFTLRRQSDSSAIASEEFRIQKPVTQKELRILVQDFMQFWNRESGVAMSGPAKNKTTLLAKFFNTLVPAAHADAGVFLGLGAGALLGVGFVAYMVGKVLSSAGQGGGDVFGGIDIIGGLFKLGGAVAMLGGGAAVACSIFLR